MRSPVGQAAPRGEEEGALLGACREDRTSPEMWVQPNLSGRVRWQSRNWRARGQGGPEPRRSFWGQVTLGVEHQGRDLVGKIQGRRGLLMPRPPPPAR